MAKEPLRILYIAQEITPYLPETAMSKVCRWLPQSAHENGCEIRIFMPCYGSVNERRGQLHEVQRLSGMNMIINEADHQLIIKVASIQPVRIQVYFIDNDDFFRRKGIVTDEKGNEFADNDERSIFFVRSVLETVKQLRWTPNIIHCHGWMTALTPLYIRKVYHDDPFFAKSKLVYSLYDDKFSNTFENFAAKVKLGEISDDDLALVNKPAVSYDDLSRLAITFADAVVAAVPEADENLMKFAESQGKKTLNYSENYLETHKDFYKTL